MCLFAGSLCHLLAGCSYLVDVVGVDVRGVVVEEAGVEQVPRVGEGGGAQGTEQLG